MSEVVDFAPDFSRATVSEWLMSIAFKKPLSAILFPEILRVVVSFTLDIQVTYGQHIRSCRLRQRRHSDGVGMVRKKLGATPDVFCYICSDQIDQFQHDFLLPCRTSCITGVEIRMPPSDVKLLVGRRDRVEPGMVRDVRMA